MKIYSCAFEPWPTDDRFWKRNSGFICKSLKRIGVHSRVILPAGPTDDPKYEVIRASRAELVSPTWWKSLEIDSVVFMTWGRKCDTPIVMAAKDAGLSIIYAADDSWMRGRVSLLELFKTTWNRRYHMRRPVRIFNTLVRTPLVFAFLSWKGRGKIQHYSLADLIMCYSPVVWGRMPDRLRFRQKVFYAYPPCPAAALTHDVDNDKIKPVTYSILAVADWTKDSHKRPQFLVDACIILFKNNKNAYIHIYGRPNPVFSRFVESLNDIDRHRFIVHGLEDNHKIIEHMSRCHIAVCPSAADAGPIPMAEALCQGCSVVGGGSIVQWASLCGFGSYAVDSPQQFADGISAEIEKWHAHEYDRGKNAEFWRNHYDAEGFAEKVKTFTELRLISKHST